MKPQSTIIEVRRRFLIFAAISGLVFASLGLETERLLTVGAQARLSLGDVVTVLRRTRANGRFVPLTERNEKLAEGVNQRGITFALTDELERELRAAGASDLLIEAIRRKSPKPTPTSTPIPAPAPATVTASPPPTTPTPKPIAVQTPSNETLARNSTSESSKPSADASDEKTMDGKADAGAEKNSSVKTDNGANKPTAAAAAKDEKPKTSAGAGANNGVKSASPLPPPSDAPLQIGSLIEHTAQKTNPVYPLSARAMRITGVVRIEILVGEDGQVAAVRKTTGQPMLQRAAIDAIRKWKFRPFTHADGRPAKAIGFVDFNFTY